jgi:hypothetical protein
LLQVQPECGNQVNDQGRTKSKAGSIHEIFPDGRCGNAHDFTHAGTDSENMPFNEISQVVHHTKLKNWLLILTPIVPNSLVKVHEIVNFAKQKMGQIALLSRKL